MECRKDITYGQFVCTVRPEKQEQNRTRFTVGGDSINYPGEVATPTTKMITAKILFNSVISTPGARFMTLDISNLPHDSTETSGIPPRQTPRHPGQDHTGVQPHQPCRPRWLRVHPGTTWHERAPTSRPPCE
eukprot:CCRYP_013374-RB/>CCRYP_013374-RB protein AED:0.33 eAED:0.33 QI:0/-1/0/1/-1/0/1/0/131